MRQAEGARGLAALPPHRLLHHRRQIFRARENRAVLRSVSVVLRPGGDRDRTVGFERAGDAGVVGAARAADAATHGASEGIMLLPHPSDPNVAL